MAYLEQHRTKGRLVSPRHRCPTSRLNFFSSNSYRNHKSTCPQFNFWSPHQAASLALLPVSANGSTMHPAAKTRHQHHSRPSSHHFVPESLQWHFNWSPVYSEPHSTQKVPSKGTVEHVPHPTINIFQWLSMLLNKDQTLTWFRRFCMV